MLCRLLIFILLLICRFSISQDRIFKKDNTKILCKIKEITSSGIKYISYSSVDSVVHTLNKEQISIIIYENGTSEVFKAQATNHIYQFDPGDLEREARRRRSLMLDSIKANRRAKNKELTLSRKNYVYYNLFELIDNSFGMSYSRNFFKNYFCVNIPFSFGYNTPYFTNGLLSETKREYFMNKKSLDIGVGINYYIYHFTYGSPYVGVMARFAQFEGEYNLWRVRDNYFILNKYYYYVTAGFRLRTTTRFTLLANIYIGGYQNEYVSDNPLNNYPYLNKYKTGASINLSLQFGYNF